MQQQIMQTDQRRRPTTAHQRCNEFFLTITGLMPPQFTAMNTRKQDHQALLKVKYCPWVAEALCTQKNNKKTHANLTSDL